MVLAPDRTRIFISYSHKDQRYLEELHAHLAYYEQKGSIDFWDDTKIGSDSRWYREIEKAIASARIAILLVSPDYLVSELNELTSLLVAAEDEGVTILPVIVKPCAFENTPLAQFQSINSSSKPLSSMNKSRREAIWEKVVELVRESRASLFTPSQALSELSLSTTQPVKTMLYTYRGHTARVNGVRWSPDGKLIASVSDDRTVQIWDAATGRHAITHHGDTGFVFAVAWSPEGKYIAAGGEGKAVHIIDALTGRQRFTHQSDAQVVAALDWSPDGKYLALGSANIWPYRSDEDIVEVIDAFTGKQVFTYRSHARAKAALAWSPNGMYLASASYDGLVEILYVASTSLSSTYQGSSDQVNTVMWSPDGRYIAAGEVDGTVQVWDTQTKRVVSTYRGYSGAILATAWAPDGQHIVSAGEGQTVQVWNVRTGETIQTYYGHSGTVYSVAWSPDGTRIASAGQDKTVQIWQISFAATEESKEQWLQEGNAYSQVQRYEEALTAFERAISLDPSYAPSYLNKGEALDNLGRYEEALAAYEQAIRLDPNYARSYHNRGNVLSKLKRYEAAKSSYKRALRLEQATGDVIAEQHEYSSLDNVQTQMGHLKEAERSYQLGQEERLVGGEEEGGIAL